MSGGRLCQAVLWGEGGVEGGQWGLPDTGGTPVWAADTAAGPPPQLQFSPAKCARSSRLPGQPHLQRALHQVVSTHSSTYHTPPSNGDVPEFSLQPDGFLTVGHLSLGTDMYCLQVPREWCSRTKSGTKTGINQFCGIVLIGWDVSLQIGPDTTFNRMECVLANKAGHYI